MNKTRKILLVFVLLFSLLVLTACGNKNAKNKTPQFIVSNESSDVLFVDEFETDVTLEKTLAGVKVWSVLFNGSLEEIKYDGVADSIEYFDNEGNIVDNIENAVKKTYHFSFKVGNESTKFSYDQHLIQEGNNEVIDIVADYVSLNKEGAPINSGLILTTSYIFEGKNISFYQIKANGEKELIENSNITFEGFPESEDLIENRKYVNYRNFEDVTAKVNADNKFTKEFNFTVRLVASAVPLSTKTATFWNWIFLQTPIAFLMSLIGKLTGGSFAIAILITTLIVRTLAWPIYAKTNDMSMKMSIAQPDLDRLQRKYAGRKDPESQQKQQMEMMQIYKKHKINMLGCLLPFLQMPIFLAMYEVVKRLTIPGGQFYKNVLNTKFIWTDLDAPDTVSKIIFTALVGVTMILLQKISSVKPSYAKKVPNKNPQAQQQEQTMKMVSYFMVIMMVFAAFATPGLALSFYWIIGNVYAIAQTLINRKLNESKYEKLQEEKLYGKSREIIDAEVNKKGDK